MRTGVAVPDPRLLATELKESVRVHNFSVSRKPSVIRFLFTIPQVLREVRVVADSYEIIVSNNIVCGLYLAIFRIFSGRRKVWIHWFTGQIWSSKPRLILNPFFWADMLIYNLVDKAVFDSPSQFAFFIDQGLVFNEAKDVWVGFSVYGVRKSILLNAKEFRETMCSGIDVTSAKDGLPRTNLMRFGYIGRISRDKGIYDLMAAFEKLNQSHLSLQFDCWGVVDDKELGESLRRSTCCNYLGEASDVSECFKQIDFLLVASFREGFGNVVLEASLFGVRSICRDIYGLRDVSLFCESVVLQSDYSDELIRGILAGQFVTTFRDKLNFAERMYGKYQQYFSDDRLKTFYSKLLQERVGEETMRHYFIEEGALHESD